MSWYKEWFLYFEILWGKNETRWDDAAVIYNINQIKHIN